MEMNAQHDVIISPRNDRGRSLTGQQIAHGTVAHNESVASTRLLTVEQVADLLRVPRSWVYGRARARDRDRLPGMRLGKYWRFRETDVLAWLETQRPSGVRGPT
jgi:excisionase family DNA binding protein